MGSVYGGSVVARPQCYRQNSLSSTSTLGTSDFKFKFVWDQLLKGSIFKYESKLESSKKLVLDWLSTSKFSFEDFCDSLQGFRDEELLCLLHLIRLYRSSQRQCLGVHFCSFSQSSTDKIIDLYRKPYISLQIKQIFFNALKVSKGDADGLSKLKRAIREQLQFNLQLALQEASRQKKELLISLPDLYFSLSLDREEGVSSDVIDDLTPMSSDSSGVSSMSVKGSKQSSVIDSTFDLPPGSQLKEWLKKNDCASSLDFD